MREKTVDIVQKQTFKMIYYYKTNSFIEEKYLHIISNYLSGIYMNPFKPNDAIHLFWTKVLVSLIKLKNPCQLKYLSYNQTFCYPIMNKILQSIIIYYFS